MNEETAHKELDRTAKQNSKSETIDNGIHCPFQGTNYPFHVQQKSLLSDEESTN